VTGGRRLIAGAIVVVLAGCGGKQQEVTDALERAGSWAATVKVITEQWAQSRVSLRFTRTTLDTASENLQRDAESIRRIDGAAAARIDRLRTAIEPVMAAVADNEPDRARDAAIPLVHIVEPRPTPPSARPE
jgi:hypothetical protein